MPQALFSPSSETASSPREQHTPDALEEDFTGADRLRALGAQMRNLHQDAGAIEDLINFLKSGQAFQRRVLTALVRLLCHLQNHHAICFKPTDQELQTMSAERQGERRMGLNGGTTVCMCCGIKPPEGDSRRSMPNSRCSFFVKALMGSDGRFSVDLLTSVFTHDRTCDGEPYAKSNEMRIRGGVLDQVVCAMPDSRRGHLQRLMNASGFRGLTPRRVSYARKLLVAPAKGQLSCIGQLDLRHAEALVKLVRAVESVNAPSLCHDARPPRPSFLLGIRAITPVSNLRTPAVACVA